jgi:hypothetical protein
MAEQGVVAPAILGDRLHQDAVQVMNGRQFEGGFRLDQAGHVAFEQEPVAAFEMVMLTMPSVLMNTCRGAPPSQKAGR